MSRLLCLTELLRHPGRAWSRSRGAGRAGFGVPAAAWAAARAHLAYRDGAASAAVAVRAGCPARTATRYPAGRAGYRSLPGQLNRATAASGTVTVPAAVPSSSQTV